MASLPQYTNVQFTSIVLDECDGARNIIEKPDTSPRWGNIHHFYMDNKFKEQIKEVLGMQQVPFYGKLLSFLSLLLILLQLMDDAQLIKVVLNENGEIVQKGSKKQLDFDNIPGIIRSMEEEKVEEKQEERLFCMDDDF
jgi:hypothetical protein